jgi:hypothetical protein
MKVHVILIGSLIHKDLCNNNSFLNILTNIIITTDKILDI